MCQNKIFYKGCVLSHKKERFFKTFLVIGIFCTNTYADVFVPQEKSADNRFILTSPAGETFDASQVSWNLFINGVLSGTQSNCTLGTYPVEARFYQNQTFNDGLIQGSVPEVYDSSLQTGQLCLSSAAILIRNQADNTTINRVRINGALNGIRYTSAVKTFALNDSWISNVRQSCLQNLNGANTNINGSLIEGCDLGIGLSDNNSGVNTLFSIDSSLVQVSPYKFNPGIDDTLASGSTIYGSANNIDLNINFSIFAFESTNIKNGLDQFSSIIASNNTNLLTCYNNQVLWMQDDNYPASFDYANPCFDIISGNHAMVQWEVKKCEWINAHPPFAAGQINSVRRLDNDPVSCDLDDIENLVVLPEYQYNLLPSNPKRGEHIVFKESFSGKVIDASNTTFILNNCTVLDPELYTNPRPIDEDPNQQTGCGYFTGEYLDEAILPLNRYPVVIKNADITILRPLIEGQTPQDSIFQLTYRNANSAAIIAKEFANNAKVYGARIDGVLDGIRVKAPEFILTDNYLTNNRDDCVENDLNVAGTIQDNLMDGCQFGISMLNNAENQVVSENTVTIKNNLIRIQVDTRYKDGLTVEGLMQPLKLNQYSTKINLVNNVFAYDPVKNGNEYPIIAGNKWKHVVGNANVDRKVQQCSNNKILWLGFSQPDNRLLDLVNEEPACFELISGQAAIDAWKDYKCSWLENHPETSVRRKANEAAEETLTCGL